MVALPIVAVRAASALERAGLLALAQVAGLAVADALGADVLLCTASEAPDALLPRVVLVADVDAARQARRLGAEGVLAESASPDQVMAAVMAVANGLSVIDPEVDPSAVERFADEVVPVLTARETEVLQLMAEGLSNPEIASLLAMSGHTAKFHAAALLDKLDAQTRTEAVVRALRLGLIPL